MGIPHYFRKITQQHANVVLNRPPSQQPCDRLFLDYNGVIHNAAARVTKTLTQDEFESKTIDNVLEYTRFIIDAANPRKNTHIYIDGVAPFAKISQQRRRRYMSVFAKQHAHEQSTRAEWDSNAISPGTVFMQKLANAITLAFPECEFSSSLESGEGEHKIFNYLHYHHESNESVWVYGLDADLIMLALVSPHRKIYLMREPVHFQNDPRTTQSSNAFCWLDVDTLRHQIINKYDVDVSTYVVLAFFLGNDFLPNLSYLDMRTDGIDTLVSAYKHIQSKPLISVEYHQSARRYALNQNALLELFESLMTNETALYATGHDRYFSANPAVFKSSSARMENYGLCNKDEWMRDMMLVPNWRKKYYTRLFDMSLRGDRTIAQACGSYLDGLSWMIDYYFNKISTSHWAYPYNYSPTITDIRNHIISKEYSPITHDQFPDIPPELQLLLILPIQSSHLLPPTIRSLATDINSPLRYMYPKSFGLITYKKIKLHECVPDLPRVDLAEYFKVYRNTTS